MKKKLLRLLAAFLTVNILFTTLFPTISYALTSGPTAPEATSFEPVDTTDLVSLVTGDFTYNMPLFELPGPSGGYPLSLSYHAGIQPNEDASWVGLGWSLNPGAITRLTNGLPDDFEKAKTTSRAYWEGGTTDISTVGISVGIANVATVSAGLSFSQDTYRGCGVGGYIGAGLGFKLGNAGSIGIHGEMGISPFGGSYSSAGISLGIGGSVNSIEGSASIGLNANSSGNISASLSGGVGLASDKRARNGDKKDQPSGQRFGGSLLGASISTGGGGGVLSGAGFTSIGNNSKDGIISQSIDDLQLDIPVWYGINIHLGRTHIRYWMDQTVNLENYGSLNFPSNEPIHPDQSVFDSYHVQSSESLSSGTNPEKFLEGSFADYDQYSVNAQGLGGNIRPHHYTLSLYSQDIVNESTNTKEILGYNIPQHSVGVQYRFVNDFSNYVTNSPPDIEINKQYTQSDWIQPDPDPSVTDWKTRVSTIYDNSNPNLGNTVTTRIPLFFPYGNPKTGMDNSLQKRTIPNVPGSKHVKYFNNIDILNNPNIQRAAGFVDCNAKGYTRTNTDGRVGAFTITSQSGINYHFSLPAYAYDEYTFSGSKDSQGKWSYNIVSQSGKYAYTWYLTGMTGPDYVDRGADGNGDGILNEYDWGYWVDFQYGKWADDYQWRNPSEGFNQDVDHRFNSFSMGRKEVYYLNAIKTKSHTALFVKEIRADGKGVDAIQYPAYGAVVNETGKFTFFPKASLSLKYIRLFNNNDIPEVIDYSYGNVYNHYYNEFEIDYYDETGNAVGSIVPVKIHYGENILDIWDLINPAINSSISIRQIDLDYDYSLAPKTFNSFDTNGLIYQSTGAAQPNIQYSYATVNAATQKLGKLTLNSITFKGKGGADLLPPTKFFYDYTSRENLQGYVSSVNSVDKSATLSVSGFVNQFAVGDIINFNQNGNQMYAYIIGISSGYLSIKLLSSNPSLGSIFSLSKTKNPPYHKDRVDIWGMYKSDFVETIGSHLNNYPSEISTRNSDAWSLREIENPTGSKTIIEYESDTFSESVLENLNTKLELPSGSVTYDLGCTSPDPYNVNNIFKRWETRVFVAKSPAGISLEFNKRYRVGDGVSIAVDMSALSSNFGQQNNDLISLYSAQVIQVEMDKITVAVCVEIDKILESSFNGSVAFQWGKISLRSSPMSYGGGIRVKRLSIFESTTNRQRSTNYTYDFNGVSNGITSYEPVPQYIDNRIKTGFNNDKINKVLSLARDIPSPGVFYKKVRVSESLQDNLGNNTTVPGYSEYEFFTLNYDMIGYQNSIENSQPLSGSYKSQTYSNVKTRKVSLKDFTQRVGKLKSVTLFDKDGRKLNETVNHFLHEEQSGQSFTASSAEYENLLMRFNKQGLVHETFNHARLVRTPTGTYELLGIISKKENYPAIQTGTTTINYKTGIKTESKTLAFDFYNGNVSKSIETDGYGNSFVTEINYAYNNYPSMGLKADYRNSVGDYQYSISNKHMIDQQAGATTYKVASATDLTPVSLVSASAHTWSDQTDVMGAGGNNISAKQSGIWRMKSSFSYVGDNTIPVSTSDGLIQASTFTPFIGWSTSAEQPGWQKNSEITLYDIYSHALEAKDVNGNFAATKMSADQTRVYTTAANSKYEEFAHLSAEDTPVGADYGGGGTLLGGGAARTSATAHTGKYSVQLNGGDAAVVYHVTKSQITTGKNFNASVWVKSANGQLPNSMSLLVSFDGNITQAFAKTERRAGDWYLVNLTIPVPATYNDMSIAVQNTGSTAGYFDDFRICPVDAAMTSYVYNQWGELTHILDNNNLYTEYRYDGMGRLTETYRESFQANTNNGSSKISQIVYNYGLKGSVFTVPITTSVTAGSGSISPSASIPQGGNGVFSILNSCDNLATRVYVDGKLLNNYYGGPSGSSITLYDGAKASLQGTTCSVVGVLGEHRINVEFDVVTGSLPQPYAICEISEIGCYTGRYRYFTFDECGRQVDQGIYSYQSLPQEVRPVLGSDQDCQYMMRYNPQNCSNIIQE